MDGVLRNECRRAIRVARLDFRGVTGVDMAVEHSADDVRVFRNQAIDRLGPLNLRERIVLPPVKKLPERV